MALLVVRTARLLLWLALLGGSISAVISAVALLMGDLPALRSLAIGSAIVAVALLIDSQARRAEVRLEAKKRNVRGFEVVMRDNSAPPAQGPHG
jgi:hypothetical protein